MPRRLAACDPRREGLGRYTLSALLTPTTPTTRSTDCSLFIAKPRLQRLRWPLYFEELIMSPYIAEFIGTALVVLLGDGAVSNAPSPTYCSRAPKAKART
jgi:hypothetical protein